MPITAEIKRYKSSERVWVFEVRDGSNCVYVEVDAREAFNQPDARALSAKADGVGARRAAETWASARAIEQAKHQFRTDSAKR
jgi:hypothetical protein